MLPATTFTQTWPTNNGDGNTAADQVTHATQTGTVTYTYVPEPGADLSRPGLHAPARSVPVQTPQA